VLELEEYDELRHTLCKRYHLSQNQVYKFEAALRAGVVKRMAYEFSLKSLVRECRESIEINADQLCMISGTVSQKLVQGVMRTKSRVWLKNGDSV